VKMWLDDKRKAPDGWTWVKTHGEAIEALKSGKVEAVRFDHDLGPGGSGYDVARWIEDRAAAGELGMLWWKVHSQNPVGKLRIQAAMRSAERFWK
jgi:hypothetical protein